MRIDPSSLVRRLTPTATRHLERAIGTASAAAHYEVGVEHFLVAMLSEDDGGVARAVSAFSVDRARFASRVQRAIDEFRRGNSGRPVFAELLFRWFEDAWTYGSLELGHERISTVLLLAQLASRPERYLSDRYFEFDAMRPDVVARALPEMLASVPEGKESLADRSAAPSGASGGDALDRFCTNVTERARNGEIDPVFGRHREIRQLIDILARRRKNNPIIVGEPGVGKTALVEGLALAIVAGEVPKSFHDADLLALDVGSLQAGASVKGEFENRLKAVISEVRASPRPIVLFIDEAHTLIGAGGPGGTGDAANLLKPALARGELRAVAATTHAEYKKYIVKDAALDRRFQPVRVDEPDEAAAVGMMRGLRDIYEEAHGVRIRDEALVAAVKLSRRYVAGRLLPDKAVDVIDTAAARVALSQHAKPEPLLEAEARHSALVRERAARQRDGQDGGEVDAEALTSLDAQIDAARAESEALIARLTEERAQPGAPMDGVERLVHHEVDAETVAQVIASWTGIPVGRMRAGTLETAMALESRLRARVVGQEGALSVVAETIRSGMAGVRNPAMPVGVLLFVGPSGVGKTETALALAETMYGGERFLTTINMSEFQERHSVSRLIGSPPGYVGFGEGGILTEAIRQRPYSVVLLDEVEKADLEVMNLFYQVFDKGTLSDSEGRSVDFRNTVVILTSNLATDAIMEIYSHGGAPSMSEVAESIRPILSAHFAPALLARMTIVPFAPIDEASMRQIAAMKLEALRERLSANLGVRVRFAPEVAERLVSRAQVTEVGGRNIEHVMRSGLLPSLSRRILERMADGPLPSGLSVSSGAEDWRVDWD